MRKNVDFPYTELIAAACLAKPNLATMEDIITHAETEAFTCKHPADYIHDMKLRSPKEINSYIQFMNGIQGQFPNIRDVYLMGKNSKEYPEIVALNQGLSQKESKSDIMAKMMDGSWIGFSIKTDTNSFLTNYSIEKLLKNGQTLREKRAEFLKSQGYMEFKKEERKEVNKLFYPKKENGLLGFVQ